MTQILKRLEIIKSSIAIEEIEIIELQIAKLQSLDIDDEVLHIIQNLEDGAYATAGILIQNYLSKFSGMVIYDDGEIQGLKLELKFLLGLFKILCQHLIVHNCPVSPCYGCLVS